MQIQKKFSHSFFFLSGVYIIMVEFTRKEYDIITKKRGITETQKMTIQELINILNRYDIRGKVKSIHRKLTKIGLAKTAKIQNISKNELNQAEKLQNKSIDELKGLLD